MSKKPLLIHRLTPSQMDERCEKGLCFNYDDKFHIGHICKAKLFVIVMESKESDEMQNQKEGDNIQVWS